MKQLIYSLIDILTILCVGAGVVALELAEIKAELIPIASILLGLAALDAISISRTEGREEEE